MNAADTGMSIMRNPKMICSNAFYTSMFQLPLVLLLRKQQEN